MNCTASVFAMLMLISTGAAANLITNSDFESGNTGFSSDYTNGLYIFEEQTYAITTNPSNNHSGATSYGDHTSGSGLMMAVNGSATAGDVIWGQTISVSAGTVYDFATYISSWSNENPAELDFSVNGFSIGGLDASSSTGIWELAFASWNSGANTTATIEIRNFNTNPSGNDFAIDDLYFGAPIFSVEVPEPGALALFVFGLAGLGYARRKRTA